jgi:hypothetical protein
MRARGLHWPVGRGVAFWVRAWGGIAAVTLTGVAGYDTTLLSVHMIQHMVLSMIAPIFLALGAPVTLALRVLPKRPRDGLTAVLHSRVARVLAHPLVAYVAVSYLNPFSLYFTGLYDADRAHEWVHELAPRRHFIARRVPASSGRLIGVGPFARPLAVPGAGSADGADPRPFTRCWGSPSCRARRCSAATGTRRSACPGPTRSRTRSSPAASCGPAARRSASRCSRC